MAADSDGVVARGVAWILLARVIDRMGGIVSLAITARYLTPSDFGLFQMALSVMVLVEILALFGFDWSLVRHPNPTREHFDTAFTLQLIAGIVGFALIAALAYPFAVIFRNPDLVLPIIVMGLLPLVAGCNNLATALLRREMRFEADFWRMFVPRVVNITACIALAIWWQNHWALIAAALILRIGFTVMGYVLHSYRPRLTLAKWHELMSFSVWVQISNFIEGLRLRIGDFVIGRALGMHHLAIYNVSNELTSMPLAEFVSAVNSAVFPKYSKIQDDAYELKKALIDTLCLTVLVGLPAAVGLSCVAPALVHAWLGPKWDEAVPIIQIVAFGALANAIGSNNCFFLMASGRPRLQTALTAILLAVLLVLMLVLVPSHGLIGAAYAFKVSALLVLPLHFVLLYRVVGLKPMEVIGGTWRSFVGAFAMSAVLTGYLVTEVAPLSFGSAIRELAIAIPSGAAVYCVVVGLLWLASGKPKSIERLLVRAVFDVLSRTFDRFSGSRLRPRA